MRILVTGGSGFVGSHVVDALARDGHELRLMLRRTSSLEFLDDACFDRIEADMRDPASLRRAVEGVDAVVHMAGLTTALRTADYFAVNAQGTGALVRAGVDARVEHFVYLSSLSAQGPSPHGGSAMPAAPRPVSLYGRSKLAGEEEVMHAQGRMRVAVVRAPVVYGPRDRGLLPFFKLAKLRILPVYGDGQNRLSWVHAFDAASAIVATVRSDRSDSVYTIADGPSRSWRQLGHALGDVLGTRPLIADVPRSLFSLAGAVAGFAAPFAKRPLLLNRDKVAEMSQRYWVCDNERITAETGWYPQVGIEEGLQATVAWYRQHRWL